MKKRDLAIRAPQHPQIPPAFRPQPTPCTHQTNGALTYLLVILLNSVQLILQSIKLYLQIRFLHLQTFQHLLQAVDISLHPLPQGLLHLKPAGQPQVESDQEGTNSTGTARALQLGAKEVGTTVEGGEGGQDSLNSEVIHSHASVVHVQECFVVPRCEVYNLKEKIA